MAKKYFRIFAFVFTLAVLSSCGSDNFRITGDFKEFGTQNIRFLYIVDDAAKLYSMPAVDGKFDYIGSSENPAIVELYNRNMELITRVVAENGDEIEISGNAKEPCRLDVSGSSINEDWFEWQNENADILLANNRPAIENAIEKYVAKNNDNPVAGLLVTCTYINAHNYKKAAELMESLDKDAKPEYIRKRMNIVCEPENEIADKTLASFSLYSSADSIESFNPANSKATLLYFWQKDDRNRGKTMKAIKELTKQYPKKTDFKVADITFETDSSLWKSAVRTDSVKWKQFWGIGGRMNAEIKALQVENAPYFIVTDSKGNAAYRGASFETAKETVISKIDADGKDSDQ